jgi:hypothetical protein
MASTKDWSYAAALAHFPTDGCTYSGCPFNRAANPAWNFCALNLSDALIRAGYALPNASNVNYCDPAHPSPRIRNADGMARVCRAQNAGQIDASTWAARPAWMGIVFFEGHMGNVTGHIDLWNGTEGVHGNYPTASTIWFWRLGA